MNSWLTFFKASARKIWDGFLDNLGILIAAFIVTGGYLVAINKIQELQTWVRSIPTDYVLTPFVLLMIALVALVRINWRQSVALKEIRQEPKKKNEKHARFITHLGVWWKLYVDSEYIEDFPYCPCCEPRLKLVQTEWHPDETYICPKTKVVYKLYDRVPRERADILEQLYSVYFQGLGDRFHARYTSELRRLKEMKPTLDNRSLTRELFQLRPLAAIPDQAREEIIQKNEEPMAALHFVERFFPHYKQFLKYRFDDENDEAD
jgi:hypothetical protein